MVYKSCGQAPAEPRLEKREPPMQWPEPPEDTEIQENKYTEASTAIVPASTNAGLQVDALERRVERYHIPSEQVDTVTKMLEDSRAKDEKDYIAGNGEAYESARKTAIAEYKKKHPLLERILHPVKYKGWKSKVKIEVPAGERTQLLESLVTTRDIVVEGYERFSKLPGILQKTYADYSKLQARETQLETEIGQMEEAVKDAPKEIAACEKVIRLLSDYTMLPAEEKQKVAETVAQAFGRTGTPSLETEAIRKRMIGKFSEGIAQRQLNAMNYNANLELSKQELVSLVEQQKMIEEQMDELSRTWLPTLKHIDQARLRYDSMSRFAESAAEIIGMNRLRARNVVANAEAKAAIQRTLAVQAESRMIAECVEEGAAETEMMYLDRTREADEVLKAPEAQVEAVEVPAEPIKIEESLRKALERSLV
ncbi:MAG: hypothetical protein V1734_07030 [Nanoarchaeota archaeon]